MFHCTLTLTVESDIVLDPKSDYLNLDLLGYGARKFKYDNYSVWLPVLSEDRLQRSLITLKSYVSINK